MDSKWKVITPGVIEATVEVRVHLLESGSDWKLQFRK